ncbi:MAG: GT4 family glycosyltransferase PelF [Actinobacteria bacterium]|nr:GT4 family glycosyltransferase PelF [Actinomycetota bacterium]
MTEGTYPFAIGGVSTWCDILLSGLPDVSWKVMPITAPGHAMKPLFELPSNAQIAGHIQLWNGSMQSTIPRPARRSSMDVDLPAILARFLIGWSESERRFTDALVWCRRNPGRILRVFRSGRSWRSFLRQLDRIRIENADGAGRPPQLDSVEAATLYQTLYWIARTAAEPTPKVNLLHVTAAGWAAIPAIVHKALYDTPILLTEHGVYLRESYLAATRSGRPEGERFVSTRLARGLARAAYAAADVISPVTGAHIAWETTMGVPAEKIRVIHNGIDGIASSFDPAPGIRRVVSVGRVDPLKDVHTMLRTTAEVLKRVPNAEFRYYGPVTDGEQAYAASCHELHARLGLDGRFRFMGATREPEKVMRESDVVLMTSISEGMPLGILEAMGQGRPVIATGVGGVSEVLRGCGVVTRPGDVHGIAMAVTTLLNNPSLADELGARGHKRARERFSRSACIDQYGGLIAELAEQGLAA